jgi:hypothetical protein
MTAAALRVEANAWAALGNWAAAQRLEDLARSYWQTAYLCRLDAASVPKPDTRRRWGQAGGTRS